MAGGSGGVMRAGVIATILVVGCAAWMTNRGSGDLALPQTGTDVMSGGGAGSVSKPTREPAAVAQPKAPAPGRPEAAPSKTAPPSAKPDAKSVSGEVRVGSWNIEWLGKPEDRSGVARDIAQDPNDLADAIIQSGVAVLGVAEVVTRIHGRPIRSREVEAVIDVMMRKTGDKWAYVLFPGRADGDQLTGVLWNTAKVSALAADGTPWSDAENAPWMLPIPKQRSAQGSYLWNRPPHAMKFSAGEGKTDFVVVMLHMKADYQGDFAAHRSEEAKALVKALPELKKTFKDSDIVLTGDTNCTAQHEAALMTFESAGFTDLNASAKTTHWRGGFMDRSFVPSDQPEFAGSVFQVGSDAYLKSRKLTPQDYKKRYSDHYLVWSTVKVMPDDD